MFFMIRIRLNYIEPTGSGSATIIGRPSMYKNVLTPARRCKKSDLKRIAKATGAHFITSLANVEGEESFEAAFLGEAAEVSQERISG